MNWIQEESEKLLKFIETAPEAELDAVLADAHFGSLANEVPPMDLFATTHTIKVTVSTGTTTRFLVSEASFELMDFPMCSEEMPLAV